MDFEKADKIVILWGIFLEYNYANLQAIFFSKIPESLLPVPKQDLYKALRIMEQHYIDIKENEGMVLMQRSLSMLDMFEDDDKALEQYANLLNNLEFRKVIANTIKDSQKNWEEMLDSNN